jgi:hypothetical protein
MSFATSLRSFSNKSWLTRSAAFGINALLNGAPVRIVLLPENEMEQMSGGYEPSESVKIEIKEKLRINDRIQFDGKNYRVQDIRESAFSPTRTATIVVSP